MRTFKNKAFISYRHSKRDMKIAKLIQESLEEYRIPEEVAEASGVTRIGRIFRDQTDLGAQADLTGELRRELQESEYLIVICSPEAADSRWVSEEIACYLQSHGADGIIAVLSEGEPEKILPEIFGKTSAVPLELIACDFRGSRWRAVREEIPRIASSLIGCRYDELVSRSRRYRRKRMAVLSAAVFTLAIIMITYGAVNRMRLRKTREEMLLAESAGLAKQSEEALKRRNRFGAIRYALSALPDYERKNEKEDRPVAGEAMLAMQKAVGAYVPEERRSLAQTEEFAVKGQIDDWDCLQTGTGTYLAVQYALEGSYGLAVWDINSVHKLFDFCPEDHGENGGSLLMTPEMILWSDGEWTYAINADAANADIANADNVNVDTANADADNADTLNADTVNADAVSAGSGREKICPEESTPGQDALLWKVRSEGAADQRILAASEDFFVVHISSLTEEAGMESGLPESLQIRNKMDGLPIPGGTIRLEGTGRPGPEEGYTELPGAAFAGDGSILVYEEDVHFYTDDEADHCTLYQVDLQTMEKKVLAEEKEILEFSVTETGCVLAAAQDGAVGLKTVRLSSGEEIWSAQTDSTAEGPVYLIPGEDSILVTDMEACVYDAGTGRFLASCSFRDPVAAAFLSEDSGPAGFLSKGSEDRGEAGSAPGEKILHIITQNGDYLTWSYGKDESRTMSETFPEDVVAAKPAGNMFLLQCAEEQLPACAEAVVGFREACWDKALKRVPLPADPSLSVSDISDVHVNGREFVLLTEQGTACGVDAETGDILWTDGSGEAPEHTVDGGRRVTVKADGNRLRFCDEERDISVEIPMTEENDLDAETLPSFLDDTPVAAVETGDGKLLLEYGDEAFVIDEEKGWVEMSAAGFLGYDPEADTILLRGEDTLYLAGRYSWQELVQKGKEILEGGAGGSE